MRHRKIQLPKVMQLGSGGVGTEARPFPGVPGITGNLGSSFTGHYCTRKYLWLE